MRWKVGLCALCAVLGLVAVRAEVLPSARAVEKMALMRTMGVDADGGDAVKVTVSSGVQRNGMDRGEEPAVVLSQCGGSVSGACLALQTRGSEDLFLGHVGQLLVGESLAERGLGEVLDYVERDLEMRLDTRLFVVKDGTASGVLGETMVDRLEAIEDDGGVSGISLPRSVRTVCIDLAQNGASLVPALRRERGAGEDPEREGLTTAGYAILKGDTLAGWAEGAAAQGIQLLLNGVKADTLERTTPEGERVALRVVGAKTKIRPVFSGDRLTGLAVVCQVEANIAQAPQSVGACAEETLGWLKRELELCEAQRLRAALTQAQRLNADFLGLKKRAGLAAPWHWAALCSQWEDRFPQLELSIAVEGKLLRSYDK